MALSPSPQSLKPQRSRMGVFVGVALLAHTFALWAAQGAWQGPSRITLMKEPIYARLLTPQQTKTARARQWAQASPTDLIPEAQALLGQRRQVARTIDASVIVSDSAPSTRPAIDKSIAPAHREITKPQVAAAPQKKTTVYIPPPPKDKALFAPMQDAAWQSAETDAAAKRAQEQSRPARQYAQLDDAQRETQLDADAFAPSAAPAPPPPISPPVAVPTAVPRAISPPAASPQPPPPPSPPPAFRQDAPTISLAPYAFDDWPKNTRINLSLTGHFRGEINGSAKVLWQRESDSYQSRVILDFGLGGLKMTSQGKLLQEGLNPTVFEEKVFGSTKTASFTADAVTLGSGKRIPRRDLGGSGLGAGSVVDAASQFVELSHRFATGRDTLADGKIVHYWLGRPEGLYQYVYDIHGPETMNLGRTMGEVETYRLTPRPIPGLNKEAIDAEIWIAPSLQYLPVRIRMKNGKGSYLNMIVKSIEQ